MKSWIMTLLCTMAVIPLQSQATPLQSQTTPPEGGNNAPLEQNASTAIDSSLPVIFKLGDIEFRECEIASQNKQRKAQCAWYSVLENPADNASRSIDLFIARLPARRQGKTPSSPMLFISGGPGQAASETFTYADRDFAPLAKHRDIYLIDQRGTGKSNPLTCPQALEKFNQFNNDYNSDQVKAAAKACLKELRGDVSQYTTENTVIDFEKVRKALEIEQWNLLGVSYGTVVASHYIRRHPEALRSAVLDSVVPPQRILGTEIALKSQDALNAALMHCAKDKACNTAMPELEANIKTLMTRLKNAPVELDYENFKTGKKERMTFRYAHLSLLIRMYLYNPYTAALLPTMLHEAAVEENYAPIARGINRVSSNLENNLSIGLHHSVMCSENIPYLDDLQQLTEKNQDTYLGMDVLNSMRDVCNVWPRGALIEDFHSTLNSDVPTLILSGEFDPITPPDYGDQIANQLNNAEHLVLKGQGHFVSTTGCAPHVIAQFVEQASPSPLNSQCLNRLFTPPTFINFNGAAP